MTAPVHNQDTNALVAAEITKLRHSLAEAQVALDGLGCLYPTGQSKCLGGAAGAHCGPSTESVQPSNEIKSGGLGKNCPPHGGDLTQASPQRFKSSQ